IGGTPRFVRRSSHSRENISHRSTSEIYPQKLTYSESLNFPLSSKQACKIAMSVVFSRGLNSGVGLAAEELSGAGAADEFASFDDGAAAGEDGFGRAFDADALEHGIVHAHVVGFGADDFFVVGIEDDQVGVGANSDGAFARVEAEEFCGGGRDKLDKAIRGKMFAVDATSINEA